MVIDETVENMTYNINIPERYSSFIYLFHKITRIIILTLFGLPIIVDLLFGIGRLAFCQKKQNIRLHILELCLDLTNIIIHIRNIKKN